MCLFPLLLFEDFCFIMCSQQFDYDTSCCASLCVYVSTWGSLSFLDLHISSSQKFQKLLAIISWNIHSAPPLSGTLITYVMSDWFIVLHVIETLFNFFSHFSLCASFSLFLLLHLQVPWSLLPYIICCIPIQWNFISDLKFLYMPNPYIPLIFTAYITMAHL